MVRPPNTELSEWSLESETAERLRALLRRRGPRGLWNGEHSPSRLVLLAVGVGVIAGLGAVLFRDLIAVFHNLMFLGRWSASYDANVHTPVLAWGAWIVLVPVAGATMVVVLVKYFAPEAKGHGVPEVIDAIYYRGGYIRPVVAVIKSLASSISIGSGGSVGREGPIIQIGAAFGSALGVLTGLPEWQRITLVACGSAGGIAATFNTPIGGLLFAVELILPEISARTIIPVALATGGATFVARMFFGDHPSFNIPALALPQPSHHDFGSFAANPQHGGVFGAVSTLHIRSIYAFEDRFQKVPGDYFAQHLLGMALVGAMIYLCGRNLGTYYIEGIGYATVQDTLTGTLLNPYLLLLLCFAKLVATALTLGSGGSGGIFSPSLFIGATLGAAYALLANGLVPDLNLDVAGAAVIGMASVVGAATGAVVTAIVMIFEMTRDYNVIVPLMITVSIAYGVRRLLLTDSIYTMKLTRRGHVVPDSFHTNLYLMRAVGDFIRTPLERCDAAQPLNTLLAMLRGRSRPMPHVLVTQNGSVLGVLSARRCVQMLRRGDAEGSVGEAAQTRYAVVDAEDMIFDVLARLRERDCDTALLTHGGRLEGPEDVVGVATWNDILLHGNLPLPLRRRRRTAA